MSETEPTAKMAEYLSSDVFNSFFWKESGPKNQDWPCVHDHKTTKPDEPKVVPATKIKKTKKPTHPTDVVFYYDEPYSNSRTYVNCDLKSYGAGSISPAAIRGALKSLAKALICAEKSSVWADRYIHSGKNINICGMLFIYNHDGQYTDEFDNILRTMSHEKLPIPKGSKIFLVGPSDVRWLDNVSCEINRMRGKKELPDPELCRFYYPNLVLKKVVQDTSAATLEALCAPWMVMKHKLAEGAREDVLVFHREKGLSELEFSI